MLTLLERCGNSDAGEGLMQGEVTLSEYADTIAASAARILADAGLNPKRSISEDADAITMLTEFWNRASGVSPARGWPWSV